MVEEGRANRPVGGSPKHLPSYIPARSAPLGAQVKAHRIGEPDLVEPDLPLEKVDESSRRMHELLACVCSEPRSQR